MDFELSAEQEAYRDAVLAFARELMLPEDVVERDAAHEFPTAAWKRCAEFGIPGLMVPTRYGGQGADALTAAVALEALGRGCLDNGLLFSLNAHMWSCVHPILTFGTPEQREEFLPRLGSGAIGVQAMSEPESGSDAFSMSTRAELDGDHYVVSGTKTFITNAPVADVFVVFAQTQPGAGAMGTVALVVDRDTPGLEIGLPFRKMGLRTSPMSEVHLDGCRVPTSRRLGEPGAGMAVFTSSMDWERSFILACTLGTVQRQLDDAVAYARERRQFGRPIGANQAVAHRLVDVAARLEAARLLLYRLAWRKARGQRTGSESAMVKLVLSDLAVDAGLATMQTYGAAGYLEDSGVERNVRDALASRIYSGTSDMQRNIVARSMGLS